MAMKTQRTSLYYIDPEFDSTGPGIVTVGCVTNMNLGGASRDQLEVTCLEDDARSYEAGLGTPGTKTFTINFDTADASHMRLINLWRAGTKVQWALGLSDGPPAPAAFIPPTLDSTTFDLPATRSWVTYEGYVADVPLDMPLAGVYSANVSVQVSGFYEVFPKTA